MGRGSALESSAREISARIVRAVSKHGWCNEREAQAFIGQIGWQVICSFGGWLHLCQNLGSKIDVLEFNSKAYEQALSILQSQDVLPLGRGAGISGAKIKARRRELGFSQHQMARRLGISKQMWAQYERDSHVPAGRVHDIALALKLSAEELQAWAEQDLLERFRREVKLHSHSGGEVG